jgi:acetyl-CoA carboxylase carboxyl transferase subunit beta
MSWIDKIPPGIRNFFRRSRVPDNYWIKCPVSGRLVTAAEIEQNHFVIPESEHHMQMPREARLRLIFDNCAWEDIPSPEVPSDPLKFRAAKSYADQLKKARQESGANDALSLAFGIVHGVPLVVGVQDFGFIGGSLGQAVGEAIIKGVKEALRRKTPFVLFTASGGARMQESAIALMQMPRTTIALLKLREAGLPFIVVLTHPTMGGVTASYGMLGDIHIAEPGALIGFAGRNIISEIAHEEMPDDMRRSEQALKRGMVDMVVHRHNLRETLGRICGLLLKLPVTAQ